ncbi:MAG: hypothetical protein AB8C84_04375 [Oligoflexales bacterium]
MTRFFLLFVCNIHITHAQASSNSKPPRDYEECRRSALNFYRNDLNKAKFQTRLDTCFHRFPGAEEYLACKRKALRSKSKEKLNSCKNILNILSFQASNPFPISFYQNNFYFAGTSLSSPKHIDQFSPLHLDCSHLQRAIQTGDGIEWIEPSTPLSDLNGFEKHSLRQQIRRLGLQKITGRDGVKVPNLGRLKGNLRKKRSQLYFPTASCSFRNDDPGSLFATLSIRYLLTAEKSTITPLLGSASYHPETMTMKEVQTRMRKQTPKGMIYFPTSYGFYVSQHKIDEFDKEKLPLRPCAKSNKNNWFVQVFKNKVKHKFVHSVHILNLKNFCSYANQRIKPWVPTKKL